MIPIKKIIFYATICACFKSYSQITLTGFVKDKVTQEVLPGAILYFPDLKNSGVSNADGSFKINNLPSTNTILQVILLGYQTVIKNIDLKTTTYITIEMEQSHIETNEILITGVSKATEIKKNPIPMVSINKYDLDENSSVNCIDIMAKTPGVNVLSTGPNVSKPYIRGLGYNRILTLFDGIRQEGQQWGDEHGIEIDQFLIDRIEVIKGPASLIYGSDALAGVINLIPENIIPEKTIKGTYNSNYQTNNGLIANSLGMSINTKGNVFGFRVSQKKAFDYQNKYDGKVYNTGFNEHDLNTYLGVNRKWGYSHLNFSIYSNLQEIPDGYRDSLTRKFTKQITEIDSSRMIVSDNELKSYRISPIHQQIKHYRLFSTNQFIIKHIKLGLKIGYQQSVRKEYSHPQYNDIAGLYLNMKTATYDMKFYLPEKKGWETTLGINGMYQVNDISKGTEFVIPNYSLFDFGSFIFTKKEFKKINIATGIRYDIRTFENKITYTKTNPVTGFEMAVSDTNGATKLFDNYNHLFKGFSGSIGLTYNFNKDVFIKSNIARGYRAPNISEISAKGVHPGTGFKQLGDDDLKPEFNSQEDIGIFIDKHHISGSIELFNNIIENYIYNQKVKSILGGDSIYTESGNTYSIYKFKQTKAQLIGGEARIDIHPHPLDWLHFENSISFIYATNKGGKGVTINDSNKYLPFIPPLHTNSELRVELAKKIKCINHAYIKIGMQYYAAQNHVFLESNTETKTNGYTLFDMGIGFDVVNCTNKKIATIGIFCSNLTDVSYQSNMNRLKYFDNYPNNNTGRSGIYNMGRNVSFKLTIPLNSTLK